MKQFSCIAFVTGMAVTTIELAAVRLLAPYFGASLFVWTNVIGVILLGLALGYVVGGRIVDRRPELRLLLRCIGIAGFAAGIAPFVVKMIAPFAIVEGIFTRTFFIILVVGSFIAALLLFFCPCFFLAMTSPFLIRLASDAQPTRVGTITGRIFGWSTAGSILGVFLTGLLFIPFFGTRATFFGTAVVLVLLSALGDRRFRLPLFVLLLLFTGFVSYA